MQQVVGSNREIEQAVIGVMLMNNGKIHEVVKTLQEDDFGQDVCCYKKSLQQRSNING